MGSGDVQEKRFPNYSVCEDLFGGAPYFRFRPLVIPEVVNEVEVS